MGNALPSRGGAGRHHLDARAVQDSVQQLGRRLEDLHCAGEPGAGWDDQVVGLEVDELAEV